MYYASRTEAIGLTADRNKLILKKFPGIPESHPAGQEMIELPLMEEDKKTGDILISVYDLEGKDKTFDRDAGANKNRQREGLFQIRRITPERYAEMSDKAQKLGKKEPGKYQMPKGAQAYPWISPNIIYDFRDRKKINTIVLTEGYIKAIAAYLQGIHIFGLSSISTYRDKKAGTLHPDILRVIETCEVENIILLYDGDCADISLKALEACKDLYERPVGFYYSSKNINELLKDHRKDRHFDVYFAHVNSKELEPEKPKGIDDLLQTYPAEAADIVKELTSVSKNKPYYFQRINITSSPYKVLEHLHIKTVEEFYSFHQQYIKEKAFIYHGTKYQWNEEDKEVKVIIPAAAKNYIRVGDDYFEKVPIPNQFGENDLRLLKRSKKTLEDDHGKGFSRHVDKFKAFCVKPDHINYQSVIANCYNLYQPFEWEPSEEPHCPVILAFLQNFFQDHYEIGLDYFQLLYQRPTEKLPILCPVSREQKTGKTTFSDFLKLIFKGNMITISNDQFESNFNSGWADKLIIHIDEGLLEKRRSYEKMKAIATARTIAMERKGVDIYELDFFAKVIVNSNREDDFIFATEDDTRFWVRKIIGAKERDPDLLNKLREEIPNFLCFLNQRQLSVPKKEDRMWFNFERIKTKAFEKLVEANKSGPERELRSIIRNLLIDTGFWEIKLQLKYICEILLRNKFDRNYIEKILHQRMQLVSGKSERFEFPTLINGINGEEEIKMIPAHGRPFIFSGEKFLQEGDLENFVLSLEAQHKGQEDLCPATIQRQKEKEIIPFKNWTEPKKWTESELKETDLPY